MIDVFVESMVTGEMPVASGLSASHAMDVIFANHRSAETGVSVDTPSA